MLSICESGAGRLRSAQARRTVRVLKMLEIGGGGRRIGKHASEFTRRLGSDADHRRALLRYANRRPMRRRGKPFRSIAVLTSDLEPNSTNDLNLDARDVAIASGSIHLVVAIGPRRYGFRNRETTRTFLSEMNRILKPAGELIVVGRYVNAWFNPEMGSTIGRGYIGEIARDLGLRLVDVLAPLGKHPIAPIFRAPGNRYVQRACDGRQLGPPTHFHRFVANKR